MKKKTGVVVKVTKSYVCIRTVRGEFFNVRLTKYKPNIGDIYTGPVLIIQSSNFRKILFFIIAFLMMFFIKNIYDYFKPSNTIILNIPPIIQLKINKFNKIIDIKATSKKSRNLISSLNIKKQNLDNALTSIIEEAKNKKIINDTYVQDHKTIIIYILGDDNYPIKLTNFDKFTKERNLKYKINFNGSNNINK